MTSHCASATWPPWSKTTSRSSATPSPPDAANDLLLVIEKFPDANTLEVTQGVEEALAALAPGLTGIEFDTTVYRPASFIEMAIGNLGAGTAGSAPCWSCSPSAPSSLTGGAP